MTPHRAAEPSPELVFDTLNAYQRTAALRAAIELNLFRAIGEGPGDVASLARQCASSERGIRILCDYLTIQGLLAKQDGHYQHTPTSAVFLDPRSPACMASAARFLGHPALAEPFARLGGCRSRRTYDSTGGRFGGSGQSHLGGVRAQHGAYDGGDGRTIGCPGARRANRAARRAGYRRRPRTVRHRSSEAQSRSACDGGRLGGGVGSRARQCA